MKEILNFEEIMGNNLSNEKDVNEDEKHNLIINTDLDEKNLLTIKIKMRIKACLFIILIIFILFSHFSSSDKNINISNIPENYNNYTEPVENYFEPFDPDLVNIYIITHKDFPNKLNSSAYKIACDNKEQLKNNYSLEIIETFKDNELYPKKIGYCEGTKMYYIWKKYKMKIVSSKYIGFNHYRRIFIFKNIIPNLDKIFKKYDVIVKKEEFLGGSIKLNYNNLHFGHFLDEILEIIKQKYRRYYPTALNTLKRFYINACNIFIMKEEDFIKYGEFVFGILIEFDKRHNLNTDNDIKNFINREIIRLDKKTYNLDYQSRQQGFLLERISNIFYDYHFKNKYQLPVTNL